MCHSAAELTQFCQSLIERAPDPGRRNPTRSIELPDPADKTGARRPNGLCKYGPKAAR
ncbi:MAG: hypothetical protein GKR89_07740 [Candidatus Latescibacteria bacterium]|nr:hypothetical protein [Candidatus Latescibacterota bacterium]